MNFRASGLWANGNKGVRRQGNANITPPPPSKNDYLVEIDVQIIPNP